MRKTKSNRNMVCIFMFSLFCGCATTSAPKDWLVQPEGMQTDVFGGWVELECFSRSPANPRVYLNGELLAINPDSLFLVNETFHAIALPHVISARLVTYVSDANTAGGLIVLGLVSTISNGYYLIFTAPMWLLGGGITASLRSYEPIRKYPEQNWNLFSQFARYPQGLPEGIDRNQISRKPGI